VRRREFITLLGGAAAWPLAARAQQAIPVIGFLYSAARDGSRVNAFRQGLGEVGFIEGRNVAVEYRWAEGDYGRLPDLVAELLRRPVAVIAASGVTAARAAKAATTSIPIVFNTGGDPVRAGLVASLSRPGGNVTGVTTLGKVLVAKQVELMHELLPAKDAVAFLVNPNNAVAGDESADAGAAAGALSRKLTIVNAGSDAELDAAFAAVARSHAGGLILQTDPFLSSRRDRVVALAAKHAIPSLSPYLDWAPAGGLLSYGSSIAEGLRLVGYYAGRILKGEKPADLPVQQSTKIELIINLKTAKALGLTLPTAILLRADDVIE
jgi:putative tryptophan/tyrosine transport system substrate-binding protein